MQQTASENPHLTDEQPAAPSENVTIALEERCITTSPLTDRIGNHLFQLASAYGIAKHSGRKLVTYSHFDVTEYFQHKTPEFTFDEKKALQVNAMSEKQICAFDSDLFELKGNENFQAVHLHAYMQSSMGLLFKCIQ